MVEYLQLLKIRAGELVTLQIDKPDGMADSQEITLYGGNAMIFDQYGLLKYTVGNSIFNRENQSARLRHLWENGFFSPGTSGLRRFAAMHRDRTLKSEGRLPAPERPSDRSLEGGGENVMPATTAPSKLTIRAYNVGFGDCSCSCFTIRISSAGS